MANQFILNSFLALSLVSASQAWAGNTDMGKHAGKVAAAQQQAATTVTGQVTDEKGEPLIGVSILVKGTSKGTVTDIDGNYKLPLENKNAVLVFSYIGYTAQEVNVQGRPSVNVVLKEEGRFVKEVVVTAMGIQRKETSLTYATQRVKAEDLMKVQDPNVANALEGKISGLTITPNAGGAGGASKIMLRGNKSILGNSAPLIVIDGVPMANDTRGRGDMTSAANNFSYAGSSEGSDPLSLINPDDIESMNVLKGANASALYGSRAANGVIMITTKKGREGKVDISVNSNVTFDMPLLTPKIQNIYGSTVSNLGALSLSSWGPRLDSRADDQLKITSPVSEDFVGYDKIVLNPNAPALEQVEGLAHNVYLRNRAGDDVADFLRTGVTINNSISISGGTEKIRTYFSLANSHADGMMRNNSYNRNNISLRQSYQLLKNLSIDASLNYTQTKTINRPGGGTVGNPLYHLYRMPRNIDLEYYKNNYSIDGSWLNFGGSYYSAYSGAYQKNDNGTYTKLKDMFQYLTGQRNTLTGMQQEWPFLSAPNNNPYWLINVNRGVQREERLFGTFSASYEIIDGLTFQTRLNYNRLSHNNDSRRYATTFLPSNMDEYGHYWNSDSKTVELYTDYLLSYNKEIGDYSLSGTAGWVGHTIKTESKATSVRATYFDPQMRELPTIINRFDVSSGGMGATSQSKSSSWDKSYLFTGQVGWKETVYVDASYRRDWYREFRFFYNQGIAVSPSYGYFGLGANAIVSSLVKLPEWFNYLKYRASISEVGNSIPGGQFKSSLNLKYGSSKVNAVVVDRFVPETTTSFETGIEALFLDSRLSFDFTFYNATVRNLYMELPTSSGSRKAMNSAKLRNTGFETTIGYDWKFGKDLRWRTSYNLSFNDNKIIHTGFDDAGKPLLYQQEIGGTKVIYKEGLSVGDMFVTDFKRDANGHIILDNKGVPQFDNTGASDKYVGNMNSKWQMGWSNTFTYKDFNLFFLINGRIGGKVISLTEADLDFLGLSQRTAEARQYAEANNIIATQYGNVPGIVLPDGSGRIVPLQKYYETIGSHSNPGEYVYNATNFRLRELSLGYTFRDLLGQNKHLSLSFIARNLFFLYNDAPVDPDVSLSTANGLGAFELYNMPSARSFGFSAKLNF